MPLKPCQRPVADAVSRRSILGGGPGHGSLPPQGSVCLGCPSPVCPPASWQSTRGSADGAGCAPAPICRPGSSARSALGADAPCGEPLATGWPARLPPCGRPPQRVWPLRSAAVAPAVGVPQALVRHDPPGKSARWRVACGGAGATPLHPLPGWPALRPASPPRLPLGSPSGSRALPGARRASHVPHEAHGMREALPVRRWRALCGRRGGRVSAGPPPLWATPFRPFGVLVLTTCIRRALPFALSSHPSSRPPEGSPSCPSAPAWRPTFFVRRHGPKRVLPPGSPGRLAWEGTDGSTSGYVLRSEVITAPRATSCRSPHRPGRAQCTHTVLR